MAEQTYTGIRYRAALHVEGPGGGEPAMLPIARLLISENYNAGWRGRLVLAQRVTPGVTSSNYMGWLMGRGLLPGVSGNIHLTLESTDASGNPDELNGTVVRSWPVALGAIEPVGGDDATLAACTVQVMDPLTFLEDRAIWGAYRGCSVGEMIGGALSMAAGGNGRPTLEPVLSGLPSVTIRPTHRPALERLEYGVAAGRSLGEWLAEVLGLLGLRIEMLGNHQGEIVVSVTDMPASGQPVRSRVAGSVEDGSESSRTPVQLTGLYGQPTVPVRATVLDDITQGDFRRIGSGSVGRVVEALRIDADEVAARMMAARRGRDAEMFALSAASDQPGFRPGRIAAFDEAVRGIERWQVAGVRHQLAGLSYGNAMTLFDSRYPWAPPLPPQRADVIVPAAVDGGRDFATHQPVPRDRLGRIPVRFPFLPADTAEEQEAKAAADRDGDGVVELSDFGDTSVFNDTAHWEREVEALKSGELDDPFPGRDYADLTASQQATRLELAARQKGARRYLLYVDAKFRAEHDRDHDGYVSQRDELVSESLHEALGDAAKREDLMEWHDSMVAGTLEEDFPELSDEDVAMTQEYDNLFGDDAGQSPNERVRDAVNDATSAAQRWPVRLPLPIVNPMAGGLHGFVPSHRHGDACRVAVHGPFSAEVIGFQYRDDRPVGGEVRHATAGFVVEHDTRDAWSGFVFRPTEEEAE